MTELKKFLAECDRNNVADGPGVALFFRLLRGQHPLTSSDLCQPTAIVLVEQLLDRAGIVDLLVQTAMNDDDFLRHKFPVFVNAAKRKSQTIIGQLNQAIVAKGIEAARLGNLASAKTALNDLLQSVDPKVRIGHILLSSADASLLSREIRLYFLPFVVADANPDGIDRIKPWIQASAQDLPQVLQLLTSEEMKLTAWMLCLGQTSPNELPAEAVSLLSAETAFALRVVARLGARKENDAKQLFERLLTKLPRTDWATAIIRLNNADRPSRSLQDGCLCLALQRQSKLDIRTWLGLHEQALRSDFATGRAPAELAIRILRHHANDWPEDKVLESYLRWVGQSDMKKFLDKPERDQLEYQFGIKSFCNKPSLDDEQLRLVADALQNLPDKDDRPLWKQLLGMIVPRRAWSLGQLRDAELEKVRQKVVDLLSNKTKDNAKTGLEAVLANLGPVVSGPNCWVPLFKDLFKRCECARQFWQNEGLFAAFVSVGMGEIAHERLRRFSDEDQKELEKTIEEYILTHKKRRQAEPGFRYLFVSMNTWKNRDRAAYWKYMLQDDRDKARGGFGSFVAWWLVVLLCCYILIQEIGVLDFLKKLIRWR